MGRLWCITRNSNEVRAFDIQRYDNVSGNVILFGGVGSSSNALNDVWSFAVSFFLIMR